VNSGPLDHRTIKWVLLTATSVNPWRALQLVGGVDKKVIGKI
jgi:hypothetical protein